MNFNKLDKIIMDSEEAKQLDDWWLHVHEGAIDYIPSVLEEGLIILNVTNEELKNPKLLGRNIQIYFKQLSDVEVYYEIYRTNLRFQTEKVISATKNYSILKSDITIAQPNPIGITPANAVRFLDSITSPHIALMNYMAFYREVRERVSSEKVRTTVTKKNHKNQRKNVRPITTILYKVSFSEEKVTEQEKKEYQRMKEAWTVRGHWRELKTGKRVWIKPHVKGDKTKVEPTTYTFSTPKEKRQED